MSISVQTQAILLMTVHFGKPAKEGPRPLSPAEWGRFALWLKERDISPGALLPEDPAALMAGWADGRVTLERIRYLLGRGAALGLALEKWQRAGLWVLTRSDPDYPARLKKHLKTDSPPVLFGCGSRSLLNQGGIAVVGSRDADLEDLAFTTWFGRTAARQGLSIVSGGARGVDETAILAALECKGTAAAVLADSLLRTATSAKYRKALMANNLVLVSTFNPEAGFDVGNAMARNKYIYCLSDAAVVVSSSRGKGGTWNGAIEDLKHRWVPLWVKPQPDSQSGNAELVRKGARWLPEGEFEQDTLFSVEFPKPAAETASLLLDSDVGTPERAIAETEAPYAEAPAGTGQVRETAGTLHTPVLTEASVSGLESMSFYDLFLLRLHRLAAKSPVTLEDLLGQIDVSRAQLKIWLMQALEEGQVEKLGKPVRYRPAKNRPKQGSIFGQD